MTTDVQDPVAAQIAALEAQFVGGDGKPDAFAREELRYIAKTVKIETAFMPVEVLERNQVDYQSEEFRAAYPNGLLALHIALEGVSVKFTGVTDGLRHIWIPLYDDRPGKYGQPKKRRSRAHVTSEAFDSLYKRRPYGADNQKFLTGQIAEWGQHLGDAEIEGEKREWAWDIPRAVLPSNYVHEGPVREVNIGRAAADGSGAQGPGATAEKSEDEAIAAMVQAITGLKVDDKDEATARILNIPGLPAKWNQAALEGTVLRELGRAQFIASDDGGIIVTGPALG